MHVLNADGGRVELELISETPIATAIEQAPFGTVTAAAMTGLGMSTLTGFFLNKPTTVRVFHETGRAFANALRKDRPEEAREPVALFRERESGLARAVKREIMVRFDPAASARTREQILAKFKFVLRRQSPDVADQLVIADPSRKKAGATLVEIANDMSELDEVMFATPNFISEYRRGTEPSVPSQQWHLWNTGEVSGQLVGEDLKATAAWQATHGKRTIIVAVLDDGVDVEHPDLKGRILRRRDRPDVVGRDFFLPNSDPDHYNPRPKRFTFPYESLHGNDIHGTPCAGIVAASGKGAYGVAYGSKILPVKILHANEYAADERVGEAIRYAAQNADVLSISWTGPSSADVESALGVDAQRLGRSGLGTAIVCATGNDGLASVSRPAGMNGTIAVGASTDQAQLASYSNRGADVDLVAPSSGGIKGIFTTDVSTTGRGFNTGGSNPMYTDSFGGTSAAAPAVAGIVALMLSANPALDRESVRGILRETADKIGSGYNVSGHSSKFGYGRANAERAVAAALAHL